MSQLNKCSKYGKSIVKWIGRILSLLAIIFIVKKVIDMEFDYKLIFSPLGISVIVVLILVQTALIFLACRAWEHYLSEFGSVKLNRNRVWSVYSKANLFKYIPGNVFQYVGRNELAVETEMTHKQVAAATVADTLTMMVIKIFVSFVLLRGQLFKVIEEYVQREIMIGILVLGILACLIVLAVLIRKKDYVNLVVQSRRSVAKSLIDYLCVDVISGIMYMAVICVILNYSCTFEEILLLAGGYTLASVIGFVTPGAPGGIGIREAVILFLSKGIIDSNLLTTAAVVMRIICIIADILAFGFAYLVEKRKQRIRESI